MEGYDDMIWRLFLIRGNILKNKLTSLITILSIVIGIGTAVSIQVAIDNAKAAFNKFVNETISNSDIILTTASSMPEKIEYDILYNNNNIETLLKKISFPAYISLSDKRNWSINIVGMDLKNQYNLKSINILDGNLPQHGEVLLVDSGNDSNIYPGDYIDLKSRNGLVKVKVSGIIKLSGCGLINGGNVAITALKFAQELYGDDYLSEIDVILKNKSNVIKEKENIENIIGNKLIATLPEEKTDYYLNSLQGLFLGLNVFSILALCIGGFIIYNTISAMVLKSSREIAILKSYGASSIKIFNYILVLGITYTLIGLIFGILLGMLLASGMLKLITLSVSGEAVNVSYSGFPMVKILLTCAAGVLISLFACIIPAIRALKITVVEGLSVNAYRNKMSYKLITTLFALNASIVLILSFLNFQQPQYKIILMILSATGCFLIILLMIRPLGLILSNLLKKINPLNSQIIRFELTNNILRIGSTIFMLVICISMSICLSGFIIGITDSISSWGSSLYEGDFMVYPKINAGEDLIDRLKNENGVAEVSSTYSIETFVFDTKVKIMGIDPKQTKILLTEVKGENVSLINNPNSAFVSNIMRKRYGLKLSDKIYLPSGSGSRIYEIIGFTDTIDYDGLMIIINNSEFKKLYSTIRFESMSLYLDQQTVDKTDFLDELNTKYKEEASIFDIRIFADMYTSSVNNLFVIFYAVICLTFLITMLVIINSMILNVHEKRYRLAILKSIGMKRIQMVTFMMTVGSIYGLIAFSVGSILGEILNFNLLEIIKITVGLQLAFHIDYTGAVIFGLFCIILTAIASIIPGLVSYRVNVIENIRRGEE